MRALRFHAEEDVRVEDVEEPVPAPGQVKLRNGYSGICGSDLHIYYEPEQAGVSLTEPHPVTGALPPQILGHEFAGEIVELGQGVAGWEVGDRAAVWPVYYCGRCMACRRGRYNACELIGFHGITSDGGGMAEFTTVDASMLHRLPESLDLKMGALVEPMSVAWHAVKLGGAEPGQTALIAGAGPIGIGVYLALRANGVDRIVVSELSPERRKGIESLGAEHVLDPTSDDLVARVKEVSGGLGAHLAFDAAGAGPVVQQALGALGATGILVVVALHAKGSDFNPTSLVMGEKSMLGSLAYMPQDFDDVITAMDEGRYDASGWVDVIGLDEVDDAIHRLREGEGMKILVESR
jgi:(R,R)-butanediol dehydrogenase / meso-butanediol dehydrogenase / diacetyl reductase